MDGLCKRVPTNGESACPAHAAGRQIHVPAQYGTCSTGAVKVCNVRNDADRIGNRRPLLEDASVQHQSSRAQCEGIRNGQNGILVEEDHRSGGQIVPIRESQNANVSIHVRETSGGIGCDDRSNLHVSGAGEHVFVNPATQLQVALCTTAAETVDRSGRGGSVEDGGRGQCVGAARTEHRVKVEGVGGIVHTGGILGGSQPHLAATQRAHVQGLGVGVGVQREHPGIVARAFENDLAGARRTAEEERGRCKIPRKADAAQSLAIGENRDRVGRHVAGIGKAQHGTGVYRDRPGSERIAGAGETSENTGRAGHRIAHYNGSHVTVGGPSQQEGALAVFGQQSTRDASAKDGASGSGGTRRNIVIMITQRGGPGDVNGAQRQRDAIPHGAARGTRRGAEIRDRQALDALQGAQIRGACTTDIHIGGGTAVDTGVCIDVDVAVEGGHGAAEAVHILEERGGPEPGVHVELTAVENDGLVADGAHG